MTKRAAAVGATVVGLALGAAAGASAADHDRGNDGPIWSLDQHGALASGTEWGPHVSEAVPEYVNGEEGGPGISPGVHLDKENGPENAGSGNAPGLNK